MLNSDDKLQGNACWKCAGELNVGTGTSEARFGRDPLHNTHSTSPICSVVHGGPVKEKNILGPQIFN